MSDNKNKIEVPDLSKGSTEIQKPSGRTEKSIDVSLEKKRLANKAEQGRRGWIGVIWGEGMNSITNIAGLLIILLLIIGAGFTFFMMSCNYDDSSHSKVMDFWGLLTPIITLALGYLFGKRKD